MHLGGGGGVSHGVVGSNTLGDDPVEVIRDTSRFEEVERLLGAFLEGQGLGIFGLDVGGCGASFGVYLAAVYATVSPSLGSSMFVCELWLVSPYPVANFWSSEAHLFMESIAESDDAARVCP
jgi:hypothetical protein